MKKLLTLLLVLAMMFSFAACGQDEPQQPADDQQQVEENNVEMQKMTADQLLEAMKAGEDLLILDVRKAADHEAAHIPGAFGIDMDAAKEGDTAAGVEALKAGLLEATGDVKGGDKKMVLVCYSGARYAQATTNCLNAIGADMENVFTLEGGFKGWSETKADLIEK